MKKVQYIKCNVNIYIMTDFEKKIINIKKSIIIKDNIRHSLNEIKDKIEKMRILEDITIEQINETIDEFKFLEQIYNKTIDNYYKISIMLAE
jgi:hypothetical protein